MLHAITLIAAPAPILSLPDVHMPVRLPYPLHRAHAREKGRDRVAEEQLGDRTVGVQKTESILPVGTVLTAVGELHSTFVNPDAFRVRHYALSQGGSACVQCLRVL